MKRFLLLFGCAAGLLGAADLAGVRTVYVLPMSHGMDEFVASHLITGHVLQVVTSAKLADAVLTDHLGAGFEAQLDDLTPAAKPNPEPVQVDKGDQSAPPSMFSSTVNKLDNPAALSRFNRAKGVVFLVDLKSREVIWSTFEPFRETSPKELDRLAAEIVKDLKLDLRGGKK